MGRERSGRSRQADRSRHRDGDSERPPGWSRRLGAGLRIRQSVDRRPRRQLGDRARPPLGDTSANAARPPATDVASGRTWADLGRGLQGRRGRGDRSQHRSDGRHGACRKRPGVTCCRSWCGLGREQPRFDGVADRPGDRLGCRHDPGWEWPDLDRRGCGLGVGCQRVLVERFANRSGARCRRPNLACARTSHRGRIGSGNGVRRRRTAHPASRRNARPAPHQADLDRSGVERRLVADGVRRAHGGCARHLQPCRWAGRYPARSGPRRCRSRSDRQRHDVHVPAAAAHPLLRRATTARCRLSPRRGAPLSRRVG